MDGIWSFDSEHHYPTIEFREKGVDKHYTLGHSDVEKLWRWGAKEGNWKDMVSEAEENQEKPMSQPGESISWRVVNYLVELKLLSWSPGLFSHKHSFPVSPEHRWIPKGLKKPHTLLFLEFIVRGGGDGEVCFNITNSVIHLPWYLFYFWLLHGVCGILVPPADIEPITPCSTSVGS